MRLREWWTRRKMNLLLPHPGGYGAVAVLRPKEAMLAWVLELPDADADTPQSLAELIPEMSAFLLPIDDGPQEAQQYVRQRWREVWEAELSQWTDNRRLWPPRVHKRFDTWFDIEIHDLVFEIR